MRRLIRLPAVLALDGLSRSTKYEQISKGLWPRPVSLGARAVGFPADECQAVIAARIAGKSNDEIRALVAQLEADRNGAEIQVAV